MRACVLSPAQLATLAARRAEHPVSSWRVEQDEDGRLDVTRLGPETDERERFRVTPAGEIREVRS